MALKTRQNMEVVQALLQNVALPTVLLNIMMGQILTQMRPPAPTFTEKECHDLSGKVFIVSGGYSGVGFELSRILYQKNSKIYIAGRSAQKATQAIQSIEAAFPSSTGTLEFLPLDLADLSTIKASASAFLAREERLDVLWNNAGVMTPPQGSKSAQGYELQLATNCLGPFLFTRLLQPVLVKTAALSPPGVIRVLFTGSVVAEINAPKGGINFEDINHENGGSAQLKYGQSKVGNIFLAAEFARQNSAAEDGVVFASLNPGNLQSELQRHRGWLGKAMGKAYLYPTVYGAYTELFAGLSPTLTPFHAGSYILPWGRFSDNLKTELAEGMKPKNEGGTGAAEKFWEWCDAEVRPYA